MGARQIVEKLYGYDGFSSQRIVATVHGVRQSIAWGDNITVQELGAFLMLERGGLGIENVEIERIESPEAEALAYPLHSEAKGVGDGA